MRSLYRALTVLGLAVLIVGCSNIDRPNLRSEFGLSRATHFSSYHHCTHHWHGICCDQAGHEGCDGCCGGCASECHTCAHHVVEEGGGHPCHFCGEEHARSVFDAR